MSRTTFAWFAAVALAYAFAPAAARGQGATDFPQSKQVQFGSQNVKLVKTGEAVRKKLIFSVYAVASYVQDGVPVRTAQDLVNADCPKVLHLIMLREVSGGDMADSFVTILRKNHPAPAFADEVKAFADLVRSGTAAKGDHILLTHIPQGGLHFRQAGGRELLIRNPTFGRAVWGIYFGPHNVGEGVKKGLLSQVQ